MLNRDFVPSLIKRTPHRHRELTFLARGITLSLALAFTLSWPTSAQAEGSDSELNYTDVQAPVLAPLSTHSRTAQIVVQQLRRNHYVDLKVNDALSSDMFDNYLEALAPGKYYFLASDIAEFEGYRYELDNALRRGDLVPAYRMFNRLQQRLIERTKYIQQAIDLGLERLDFNTNEIITIKRESVPWPTNLTAQNDLWNRRLKSQVLRMKLNDKEYHKSKGHLLKHLFQ